MSVFLFLIVPSMVLSLFAVTRGTPGFVVTAVSVILRDLALCGLVLFFLWRNGEPRQRIGWTSRDWMRQAALGVLLFPLMFVGAAFCAWMFSKMGLSSPRSPLRSVLSIRSVFEAPLAVLLVAVVAVTEETIFRGYLFLRLGAVTGRMPWAVFLSTVIFAMGHGYEGGVGLATVGLIGLTLGLVYLRHPEFSGSHRDALSAGLYRHRCRTLAVGSHTMTRWELLALPKTQVENLSIFQPASPPSESIRTLSILLFAIAGLIFVVVEGVLVYNLLRFRQTTDEPSSEPPQVYGGTPIEIAWTVAPTLIVCILVLVLARRFGKSISIPLPQGGRRCALCDGHRAAMVVGIPLRRVQRTSLAFHHRQRAARACGQRRRSGAGACISIFNRPTSFTASGCRGWPARLT